MRLITKTMIAATIAAASATANAYQAGDIILRAGAVNVSPDASSQEALPGIRVDVDSNTQLGLSGTYMFSPNIGLEVLAATPFSHDITLVAPDTGLDGVKAGDTKHLPPTVSLQYYFNDAKAAFQPYAGVGINYTIFFEEGTSQALEDTLDNTSLSLDSSLGLAFQLGFDYALSDNLALNAAVWNIDIETTATLNYGTDSQAKFDVTIDPWVYMVGVAYKF